MNSAQRTTYNKIKCYIKLYNNNMKFMKYKYEKLSQDYTEVPFQHGGLIL